MAHLLAEQGKPFASGELIKSCLVGAAEKMCPDFFQTNNRQTSKEDLFKIANLIRTVAQ